MILIILSILHFLWHVALFLIGIFLGSKAVKHCCKCSCHKKRKTTEDTTEGTTDE